MTNSTVGEIRQGYKSTFVGVIGDIGTMTSLEYSTKGVFLDEDVAEWMWKIAESRPGYYCITAPVYNSFGKLKMRRVNFTQKEYKDVEAVVTNQIMAKPKDNIFRTLVYQRANMIWPASTDDHLTMKTVAPWAMCCYKTQPIRVDTISCCGITGVANALTRLLFKKLGTRGTTLSRLCDYRKQQPLSHDDGDSTYSSFKKEDNKGNKEEPKGPSLDKLGYQAEGAEYCNTALLGSSPTKGGGDGDVRANISGRLVYVEQDGEKLVGVVGQCVNDEAEKQICGVVSLPISDEPNVYAQDVTNVEMAIEERINKKQRPCTATPDDQARIGKVVAAAMGKTKKRRWVGIVFNLPCQGSFVQICDSRYGIQEMDW